MDTKGRCQGLNQRPKELQNRIKILKNQGVLHKNLPIDICGSNKLDSNITISWGTVQMGKEVRIERAIFNILWESAGKNNFKEGGSHV